MIKAIDHGSMWPTSAIVGGFAAFGQHIFARMIDIPDPFAWFATGLFELVMISFLVRGWLRARKNLSPLVPWFVATCIGVISIFVQLMHSANIKQAVFYGVASGLVLLLWFTKLYDSYRQVLREMGKIVTPIPKYGRMWLLDFRRAWWGMRVGTAIQCDEIEVTAALAWTYIATSRTLKHRGVRSDLRKITAWNAVYEQVGLPTIVLPQSLMTAAVGVLDAPPVPQPEPVPVPVLPAVPAPVLAIGATVSVPESGTAVPVPPVLLDGTGTAGTEYQTSTAGTGTGSVPAVGTGTAGTASRSGTGGTGTASVPQAGTGGTASQASTGTGTGTAGTAPRPPRPPVYVRAVPVSPAPAGPKTEWTPNPELLRECSKLVDDLVEALLQTGDPLTDEKELRFYRGDLVRLAVTTHPANPDRDEERWGAGNWLTNPRWATKDECIAICRRGGTHAMKISRHARALRDVTATQN